ncbi:hypothetical protein BaRGS_00013191 [Batillaria attramentaria]|uniref:Uncharacterized protein n=1 Tax=Batillaria attramentaria TaxID=370345 RepID=A0ABD0L8K2_9CAEN
MGCAFRKNIVFRLHTVIIDNRTRTFAGALVTPETLKGSSQCVPVDADSCSVCSRTARCARNLRGNNPVHTGNCPKLAHRPLGTSRLLASIPCNTTVTVAFIDRRDVRNVDTRKESNKPLYTFVHLLLSELLFASHAYRWLEKQAKHAYTVTVLGNSSVTS